MFMFETYLLCIFVNKSNFLESNEWPKDVCGIRLRTIDIVLKNNNGLGKDMNFFGN